MELISKKLNFDFIGNCWKGISISLALLVMSFYIWFAKGESKYGIDFKGGHELVVKITGAPGSEKIREMLVQSGVDDIIVQSFEIGSDEYSIRLSVNAGDSKTVREKIDGGLKKAFDANYQGVIKSDFVGPTIGEELRTRALYACLFALIGILIYVAYRFEMAFALGAVVALFHDVIVAMGVYLMCGHTINVGTVAAALTIVGYSVNDTIVIFDRVREEILKHDKFDLAALMNESINATLSRTIITSMLTIFSVLALLIFGGGAIADLSVYLLAGMVAGCYSTIFIASPVALWWNKIRSPEIATAARA